MIRRLNADDLAGLMRLYSFFHLEETSPDETDPIVQKTWQIILADPNQRYYGSEIDGQLVSTCMLTIIPSLSRTCRPYGLIENVITDPAWRKRGLATEVLQYAQNDAWSTGLYKVMLLTGSKTETTFLFYEKAGFQRNIKTGFVAYPAATSITK